ncbi:U3 small nucleolar RNA-associated protein 15 [Naganishia albida]|nr:U3 small nucleolar RNA-associated protein 15 [Naganishia albida]
MDFLPLPKLPQQGAVVSSVNPHSRYYHSFRHPLFIRHHNPITSIHFSPTRPHRFAITTSSRLLVYAPKTGKVVKTITRFKDNARGAEIRKDGKLVVAGGDDGLVQVFDLNSRAILRTMKGHDAPVHVTRFSPTNTEIISASDDATLKLWDIPSQTCVQTFSGHNDYVRSALFSPSNPQLILSGSYDSTIRLWDTRTGQDEIVMSHGSNLPVEDILMFPGAGSNVALSAGGPILRVWDLAMVSSGATEEDGTSSFSGKGKCVRALSNHQKTISCMSFDGERRRVLTGGLDMMVKVYDVEDWKVVHTMRYPAPILSLAVSPDDTHIAAGMTDGTLSLRRRDPKAAELAAQEAKKSVLSTGAYEYFADVESVFGTGHVKSTQQDQAQGQQRQGAKTMAAVDEFRVENVRRKKLKDYDKFLKTFKYGAALDAVMVKTVRPVTAFALIQELIFRDGLRIALGGRDDVTMEPILNFLARHIDDSRFGGMAAEVADVLIDMYSSVLGQSPLIDDIISKMQKKVHFELQFQKQLLGLNGALEMVLAQAALAQTT